MDGAELDRLIATLAADVEDLVASTRDERDRRRAAGEDVTWLDQLLHECEPLTTETHDVQILRAIRAVVDRHGPGPYPVDDLAAIAGITIDDARRLLNQMVAEGLAAPDRSPEPGFEVLTHGQLGTYRPRPGPLHRQLWSIVRDSHGTSLTGCKSRFASRA